MIERIFKINPIKILKKNHKTPQNILNEFYIIIYTQSDNQTHVSI